MQRESIVLDTDAFHAIRTLSLLAVLAASASMRGVIVVCRYAARRELRDLDDEIRRAEAAGWLVVRGVERRTPEDERFRRLVREGVDKGEAEAIAWSASRPAVDRPIFFSVDRRARIAATGQRVRSGDVMDLVVLLVEKGVLERDVARERLGPWADPHQQLGRPRDLTPFEFDKAYDARRARWAGP